MPVVQRSDFDAVVGRFTAPGQYSADTETTGLRPYQGHRLFSLILADATESFYFNFLPYLDVPDAWVLPREWLARLAPVFANPDTYWFMANAKFDLAMLANEGLEVAGTVHCTEAIGRVVRNDLFEYGLDAAAKRIGLEKSSAVEDYIAKHKLFTEVRHPGKKKKTKDKHFDKVPFEIIAPYGVQDGTVTRAVGIHQLAEIERLGGWVPSNTEKVAKVAANEIALTKVCFAMERRGILIDRDYCTRAMAHEVAAEAKAMQEFTGFTGLEFVDGPKVLCEAFTKMGEKYPLTEKGNPSFTDEVLEGFTTPVAQLVRNIRSAHKMAYTYYANFLHFADSQDVLHANIQQGGAETGRCSVRDPALQTIPKEEDASQAWIVKRAFIPRPGFVLADFDFRQQEYRLMADYAGEKELIRKVMEEGLDVHKATAEMMGVARNEAKTINFMLLFGGGPGKLAHALGIPLREAIALRDRYFEALPNVRQFIRAVISVAERRGYIVNWLGRIAHFTPQNAYIASNSIIQGGGADICKRAMIGCHEFLRGTGAHMLLQVHDALLFEIPENQLGLVAGLKQIMIDAYPHRHLPMDVDVAICRKSWGDKEKWT